MPAKSSVSAPSLVLTSVSPHPERIVMDLYFDGDLTKLLLAWHEAIGQKTLADSVPFQSVSVSVLLDNVGAEKALKGHVDALAADGALVIATATLARWYQLAQDATVSTTMAGRLALECVRSVAPVLFGPGQPSDRRAKALTVLGDVPSALRAHGLRVAVVAPLSEHLVVHVHQHAGVLANGAVAPAVFAAPTAEVTCRVDDPHGLGAHEVGKVARAFRAYQDATTKLAEAMLAHEMVTLMPAVLPGSLARDLLLVATPAQMKVLGDLEAGASTGLAEIAAPYLT
ncbi:MAG: hypothetical protein C0497_05875 [Gemmatimonas sp.]|nr:hypothetical protein [Gemmatimonas sp.]